MGNNQSQSSDEEDRQPTYRYHENVLRNAQLLTEGRGIQREIPGYESDNDKEEYFSADEGNDSDRSITPPRTRPESSSGEDFSDDSMEEDEENEQAQATHSDATIHLPPPSMGPSRMLRSKRSCGQCNISRLEEHDSITAELETSRWHLNDTSVLCSRHSLNSGHNVHETPRSPFVPIRSPPGSFNVSKTNFEKNQSLTKSPKRKSSRSPKEKGVPPQKRYSSEVSPWKRGIGYYDSSDSDDDIEERSKGSSTHHGHSPKRAKPPVCQSVPGSKRASGFESVRDDSVSSPKHRRVIDKKALVEVISNSTKRHHSREQTEVEDRMKRMKSSGANNFHEVRIDKIGNVGNSLESSQNVGIGPERRRLRSSAFYPCTEGGDSRYAQEKTTSQGSTFKMGNSGVRNSFGKLVPNKGLQVTLDGPLKDQLENDHVTEISAPENENISSLSNIVRNLREGKMKRKLDDKSSPVTMNESSNSSFQQNSSPPNTNPFANVVLTPASPDNTSILKTPSRQEDTPTKKKSQSTAERLKQFLIHGNFKSIFSSKSKCTSESGNTTSASHLSSSPSSLLSNRSNNSSNLLNNSTHVHFSSSPAEPSKSHSVNRSPTSFSLHQVSPIFASLPTVSPVNCPANSTDRETNRYSSILEMSAQTRETHQGVDPNETSTRTSPRLQQSYRKSVSPSVSTFSSSVSADVSILPQMSQFQVLHFELLGTLEVSVSMGDIADEASAGIVNWTDEHLTHTVTECSRQIAAKAGALMRAGCTDYLTNKGAAMEAPDVLTTPAGGRFPKSVEALLHVVGPQLKRREKSTQAMTTRLLEVYANCLRFANERLGLRSLSLPLIGQDMFTDEVSIRAFFDSILIFLSEGTFESSKAPGSMSPNHFDLTSVSLVLSNARATDLAAEVINASIDRLKREGLASVARDTILSYQRSDSSMNNHPDDVDRATSGRPRTKRPRL